MIESNKTRRAIELLLCIFSVIATAAVADTVFAAEYRVLHNFCGKTGCADGAVPGAVILDQAGSIYGVTEEGGHTGLGVVFELDGGSAEHRVYARLHDFCKTDCKDGRAPSYPLIRDIIGNLYGTTPNGGSTGGGVAFELTKREGHWTLKVLHTFCSSTAKTCQEGSAPSSGLTYEGAAGGSLYDGHSPLFGTTSAGGAFKGGTAFRLVANAGHWRADSLHDFCLPPSCAGGATALGGLVVNPAGDIFGVANLGGAQGEGAIFQLSPDRAKYTYAVIYNFCSQDTCTDGTRPSTALALDFSGNLYGTTPRQGTHDAGTLFELSPNGSGFDFQVLYQFCSAANCTDGGAPAAPLTLDQKSNIFGTTSLFGDAQGRGTLFELSPSKSGWTQTVLHDFCAQADCVDGALAMSGVVLNKSGNLLGTTAAGGSTNAGVVYEFMP